MAALASLKPPIKIYKMALKSEKARITWPPVLEIIHSLNLVDCRLVQADNHGIIISNPSKTCASEEKFIPLTGDPKLGKEIKHEVTSFFVSAEG